MKVLGTVIALALVAGAVGACAGHGGPKATPTAQAPAPATPMVEVTATALKVHATPSATGAVVGSLKQGDRVAAPQPESGGWLYVESDAGTKGYVSSRYVQAVAESATPAATEPAPAAAPAATSTRASRKASASPPPPNSKLARITNGMTEAQVVEILGAPTSQQNYITGKAFIPYYYGPDTARLDYRYKGLGIVVFSRNRYSGGTKVIRVDYDPNEDGYP